MSGEHSIIPPSSAARRVQCRASRGMEARQPPRPETDAQREGTAAHELAATMIRSYARAGAGFPDRAATVGTLASNGVLFDDDMYDAALMYADEARGIMISAGIFGGENLRIEERIVILRLHPLSWGTPDFALYDRKTGVLYVLDFKYGHRVVEAWQNWQFIEYVAGLLDVYGVDATSDQYVRVRMGVIQPRAPHRDGPIRYWEVMASDLRAHFNLLAAVEAESLSDNPTAATGSECLGCAARHDCSLLQSAASAAMAYSGSTCPAPLTPEQLAVELSLIDECVAILKARRSGLEVEAEARIAAGTVIPGWGLERGRTHEVWTVPAPQVITMGDMMGVDLRKEAAAITPKQAIKAGLSAEIVKSMSGAPLGEFKLIRSENTKAARAFGKLKGV